VIQISFVGEYHVAKQILRTQSLEVARTKAFSQFTIIRAVCERSTSDHSQVTLAANLDRHGKALQPA